MKTLYPWVKNCHYRISAKAIIKNNKGEIALCLKRMLVNWVNQEKWDIPGWGIEHWEDIATAIRRETYEETGLIVTHISPQPLYFFLWESAAWDTPLVLACYEVTVQDFDFDVSDECLDMQFFTLEEALKADTYCMVTDALKEIKKLYWDF